MVYVYKYYHIGGPMEILMFMLSLDIVVSVLALELSCIAPPQFLVCGCVGRCE